MATFNFDELTSQISNTVESGVSFAGKGLKLDDASSAASVVSAINACKSMTYLNLEGNTLGVEAAEVIAKAIEGHPEFKKALWKDLFTGRMKTEIPKALHHLGTGMINAHARLTVLDLSDNAFGPNGMEGLVVLLGSPCYALEELRLNNNGLGIGGGRMLAKALLDCHSNSKKTGKALSLKVFVAGRNRLENDGSKALAEVFKTIGTLEEISMPQNGIYAPGITALSEAFAMNKNLRVLNLNDNTIGEKGAQAIAKALPHIQQLEEINFGDCLLKTAGAQSLANALKEGHTKLETLVLGFNEISTPGGVALVEALQNKSNLKSVILDGNQFGDVGKKLISKLMQERGQDDVLGSLSDDEGEPDDDETDSDNEEESEASEDEYPEAPVITPTSTPIASIVKPSVELAAPKIQSSLFNNLSIKSLSPSPSANTSIELFLQNPSQTNFLALGNDRENIFLKEVKNLPKDDEYLNKLVIVLMKVSGLCKSTDEIIKQSALSISRKIYKELFSWSKNENINSLVNNTLLVNLGLIKSEDKKFKPSWDVDACLVALDNVLTESFFPNETKETLQLFLGRQVMELNDTITA